MKFLDSIPESTPSDLRDRAMFEVLYGVNPGDEVMKILRDLNKQGTSIVIVTHSPAYAKYAHRTIQLFDGKISQESVNGN